MEDIISMSPFSIKLLIIGLAIVALILTAYYRIDGFDSDPAAGRSICDPTCSGFGRSKVTGRPCCHDAVGQVYPKRQSDCPTGTTFMEGAIESENRCLVCVEQRDGTTKCHSPGNYDTTKFRSGTINEETSKTDVLEKAAIPAYITEIKALRKLEADIHGGRDSKGRELYSRNFSYLDDDDGIITSKASDLGRSVSETNTSGASGRNGSKGGSWSNNNYWLNGRSGSKGGTWRDSDDRNSGVSGGAWDRKDPAFNTKPEDTPKMSNSDSSSDSSNSKKKLEERPFERPCDHSYDEGAKMGYDSCNKFSSCDNDEEVEDTCEGFSPLL